jgi:hypothetical protein
VDDDELFDVLTAIDSAAVPDKAERFQEEAQRLEPGAHGRASLLIASGEHWQMRGEYDKAQVSFDAARADGGESAVDPEVALFGLAMERGAADAAAQHLATLKGLANAEQLTLDDYLQIGEIYEGHGELRHAHRWLTMPLTYADPDDDDLDYLLLVARLRVREALGLSRDRFDQVAFEEREQRRAELE